MIPKYCFKDDDGQLWFKECLTPSVGNSLRVDELIYAEDSDLQHLILFDNETHGRVLAIDGLVQVSMSRVRFLVSLAHWSRGQGASHPGRVISTGSPLTSGW